MATPAPPTNAPSTTTTATATPDGAVTQTTVKPGAKTSEHVLAYVALALTAAYSTGLIPTTGVASQIAACVAAVLISLGYMVNRTWLKSNASAILLVMILGFGSGALTACATTSQTETTLKTTLAATNGAEAAFVLYDAKHQGDLVAAAQTKAEGVVALAAYRDKRAQVIAGFSTVYKAIAAAALAKDGKSLDALTLAAGAVEAELHSLGVTP